MIRCELFDCVASIEEVQCEEPATQFFRFEEWDGQSEHAVAACDRHAHVLIEDGIPITKQMYDVFRVHDE